MWVILWGMMSWSLVTFYQTTRYHTPEDSTSSIILLMMISLINCFIIAGFVGKIYKKMLICVECFFTAVFSLINIWGRTRKVSSRWAQDFMHCVRYYRHILTKNYTSKSPIWYFMIIPYVFLNCLVSIDGKNFIRGSTRGKRVWTELLKTKKPRGLSLQMNYTDWETAACQLR
jgi:hypothetical protein